MSEKCFYLYTQQLWHVRSHSFSVCVSFSRGLARSRLLSAVFFVFVVLTRSFAYTISNTRNALHSYRNTRSILQLLCLTLVGRPKCQYFVVFFLALFLCFQCNCNVYSNWKCNRGNPSAVMSCMKNICVRIARKHMHPKSKFRTNETKKTTHFCQNHMSTNTDCCLAFAVVAAMCWRSPFSHSSVFVSVHVPEPHNITGCLDRFFSYFLFCATPLLLPKSIEPFWNPFTKPFFLLHIFA